MAMEEDLTLPISFYIPLTPHMLRRNFLYIPSDMVSCLKSVLPRKVLFEVPNGDVYECLFEGVEGSFIGLGKLIQRLGLTSFCMLFFQYVRDGVFLFSAVNSACVEVEYPIYGDYFSSVFEIIPVIPPRQCVKESAGYNIMDDVNGSLLEYNSDIYTSYEVEILFHSMATLKCVTPWEVDSKYKDIFKDWKYESTMILVLCERLWNIIVRKQGSAILFCEGWKTFIDDLVVGMGDLCVLRKSNGNKIFEVALFRNYVSSGRSLMLYGAHVPNKFIKFLCKKSLCSGQIGVPRLFYEIHREHIPANVTLDCGGGRQFKASFNLEMHILGELKEMFDEMSACDDDLLLFVYEGSGAFKLCHYTGRFKQKNCCTHIVSTSYDATIKTIYQCSSA